MVKITSLLTFFFLICLSSCQVKEAASSGGLFSGHAPTTNKFSLTAPANKVYVEGEILRFKVSFPFDIESDTTLGDPLLNIKIGGTNRAVALKDFSTLKDLIFEYTITNADNAPTGIEVQGLALNGSVLEFLKDGVLVNCDTSTIQPTLLSQVKIDTEKPSVTSMTMSLMPNVYHTGDEVIFSLGFSEKVFVTGIPEFSFKLDTKSVTAKYVSGSGSTLLLFSYKVQSSDYDITGFDTPVSDIILPSATIKDSVGNGAITAIAAGIKSSMLTVSAIHQIIANLPYVVAVKLPANDVYVVAKTLNFEIEFDRAVNVSAGSVPKYEFAVGAQGATTPRYANYVSGSGTKKLIFSYVTVPGDVDPDGIEVAKTIMRDGLNDIVAVSDGSSFFTALSNNFTPPSSAGIILKSLFPQVISVARNADITTEKKNNTTDNVWIIGQTLLITANFNTGIHVNVTNGRPAIEFFIGGIKKEASYLSGGDGQTSLIFTYDIVENDFDNTGDLTLGAIVTHGGTITDSVNTIANLTLPASSKLNTIRIDGIRPTISSLTPPPGKTYSNNNSGMDYVVGWSEEVHLGEATDLGITIDIDGSNTIFKRDSAKDLPLLTTFIQPTIVVGKNDNDGVLLISPLITTGKVFDIAGNEATNLSFTPPVIPNNVLVDTILPQVISINPVSAARVYVQGEDIIFKAIFDEEVTITAASRIRFKIGTGGIKYLIPTSIGKGLEHEYKYTIALNDNGSPNSFMNVTNARDIGNNPVENASYVVDTTGFDVDTKAPTISSTQLISPSNILVEGNTLKIKITYSENMTIDGDPVVLLDFGMGENNLTYESGDGTNILVFSRTISANHFNMNGLPISVKNFDLSSGTIKDKAGLSTPSTFPTGHNLSTYKITYPQVIVWSQAAGANLITGNPSLVKTGSPTTSPCGLSICTSFNNPQNLQFNADINQSVHVLMILKTPTEELNHSFLSTNLNLEYDPVLINFLPTAPSGTLAENSTLVPDQLTFIDASLPGFAVTNNSNLLSVDFNGAIGDIIIVDPTIPNAKLDNIRDYLNLKFFP